MEKKTVLLLQRRIKWKLSRHLKYLGFKKCINGNLLPPNDKKKTIRSLHSVQRKELLTNEKVFLAEKYESLCAFFASGVDVIPQKISPRLELINSSSWQSDLFRIAGLTWSIPVSKGYGRRMRFLVWDDFNEKIMGIIALGDPVFNSRVRDEFIGWSSKDREKRLVNCMDAFILGAVPPYNFLLGGKTIACLIKSSEVKQAFRKKYGKTRGIISKKKKGASLSLITTSSALGKSSVYNRLKLKGQTYFESIGYTEGWGHFHIPNSLFMDIREYLSAINHPYANGHQFGTGPNWRMRATKEALRQIGLDGDLLKHGVFREVYVCKFIENYSSLLSGKSNTPRNINLKSVKEIGELALDRWMIPRSERKPDFLYWKRENISKLLLPENRANSISLNPPRNIRLKRTLKQIQNNLTKGDYSFLA